MNKHSIRLDRIYCTHPSESNISSGDEVYLVCQADGGLPIRIPAELNSSHSMKAGDTWDLNQLVLHFRFEQLVTLWDHDAVPYDPNLATYLQSHDFQPGTGGGSLRLTNRNGADYSIFYTYLD